MKILVLCVINGIESVSNLRSENYFNENSRLMCNKRHRKCGVRAFIHSLPCVGNFPRFFPPAGFSVYSLVPRAFYSLVVCVKNPNERGTSE